MEWREAADTRQQAVKPDGVRGRSARVVFNRTWEQESIKSPLHMSNAGLERLNQGLDTHVLLFTTSLDLLVDDWWTETKEFGAEKLCLCQNSQPWLTYIFPNRREHAANLSTSFSEFPTLPELVGMRS